MGSQQNNMSFQPRMNHILSLPEMQEPSLQNRSKNLMKKETFTISSTSFKKSSPGTTLSASWNQGWKASWLNPRQCNYDYEEAEEHKNDGEDEDENEDEDEDEDEDDDDDDDDGGAFWHNTLPFLAVPATSGETTRVTKQMVPKATRKLSWDEFLWQCFNKNPRLEKRT